jgi:hypothetical protein
VMPELLLVARHDEHFAKFWQYAEKDEADAPRAMKELIAGRGPVQVTEQEGRDALAWCDGRVGWIPTPGRLPFFGPYAVSVVTRAS